MSSNRLRPVLTVALLSSALAVTCYWWQRGRTVSVVDAPAGRTQCVSYAPYHRPGQTPFAEGTLVPPAQIEHDLRQLAGRFDCVRTYSVGQGLDAVPAIAHGLGMQVLLGIWLGRDRNANAHEMALGIRTARAYRDTVRAVIVGNEVLLRGELPETELAADISAVHVATAMPVTYADVWEYWLKHPRLAAVVSFVTIHILPYWEDHPVAIDAAVQHVRSVHDRLQAAFPGKPILIGETGWPSAGRQRGGALPSRVNEARFMRGFLNYAARSGITYNLVEAYDQPWKRWLEGTAGGYWGLYTAAGQQKFSWQGAVTEDPDWYLGVLAGLGLALCLYLSALARRLKPGAWHATGLLLGGYAGGAVLAVCCQQLSAASRDTFEWMLGASWALLELITICWCADILGRYLQSADTAYPERRYHIGGLKFVGLRQTLTLRQLLQSLWLFAAAVVCLLLVFDPRYRGFPLALFLPAACGFGLLSWVETPAASRASLEQHLLAVWLGIASILIAIMEGLANTRALSWSALCVVLCLSVWIPCLRTRQDQHADH